MNHKERIIKRLEDAHKEKEDGLIKHCEFLSMITHMTVAQEEKELAFIQGEQAELAVLKEDIDWIKSIEED